MHPDPANEKRADRRAAPRIALDLPVSLRIGGLPAELRGHSCDLSVGGMCVRTHGRFALADVRRVTLLLPDGSLELDAEGCWQLESVSDDAVLSGIRFLDPPFGQRERLWDVVHDAGKRITHFLSASSALAELAFEEIMELAHMTRFREIRAGRWVYRQDVDCAGEDVISIVMCGSVVLETRSPAGRRLVLEQVGPGGLIGGVPMVAAMPHQETAMASTPTSVLDITRPAFENLKRVMPALAFRLAAIVVACQARRLHATLLRREDTR